MRSEAMQSVSGKSVLITGAAMGMGKLYAELAVREGARMVMLWDINDKALSATASELRALGGNVLTQVVDVSRLEAIEEAAARTRKEVGLVEILFNNAGVVRGKWFWEHDNVKDIGFTMAVNALAPMYIAREFLPAMMKADTQCRIVNIASAAGLVSNPRMSVYCASKWSCTGWSDSLRLELEHGGYRHVKVTTVNPTFISTGMFEGAKSMFLTPILTPEYVVRRVWAAMKKGKVRVIMPWTVYISNALKGLLPVRWVDFIVGRLFGVYNTMEYFKGRGG